MVQMSAVAWPEFSPAPPELLAKRERERRGGCSAGSGHFSETDAKLASELFNATGRRARSHVDCMSAEHAMGNALLATLNIRDFVLFEKLS